MYRIPDAVLLTLILSTITPLTAEPATTTSRATGTTAEPSTQATEEPALLFAYDVRNGELVEPDPRPLLRVYEDGRVVVTIRPGRRNSGERTRHLSEAELGGLIAKLNAAGFFGVTQDDVEQTRALRREKMQKADAEGKEQEKAACDDTFYFFTAPAPETKAAGVTEPRIISWYGLANSPPQLKAASTAATAADEARRAFESLVERTLNEAAAGRR